MHMYEAKSVDELVACALKQKNYKGKLDFFDNPYNYIIYHHLGLLLNILKSPENKPSKHDIFIVSRLASHSQPKTIIEIQEILNIYKVRDMNSER